MMMIQYSVTLIINGLRKKVAVKKGKHIHDKMCENDEKSRGEVWLSDHNGEKPSLYFLFKDCEPATNPVYQFHGCQWNGHIAKKSCMQRHKGRYRDTWQIHSLIANYSWNTRKFNLVSIWGCEKSILTNIWFQKEFTLSSLQF